MNARQTLFVASAALIFTSCATHDIASHSEREAPLRARSNAAAIVAQVETFAPFEGHVRSALVLRPGSRDGRAIFETTTSDLHVEIARDATMVRISIADRDDLSLTISPMHRAPAWSGIATELAGAVVVEEAESEVDVVHVVEGGRAEEIRLLRSDAASSVHRFRVKRGAGIHAVRLRQGRIEALDAEGVVQLHSAPMFAVDAHGERRDVVLSREADALDEATFTARLDPTDLTYPIAIDPIWTTAPPMSTSRSEVSTVTLPDGRVVVIGGAEAEIYNPKTNTWSLSSKSADFHSGSNGAVLLASGKILAAKGAAVAEVWDPGTDKWTAAGTPTVSSYSARVVAIATGALIVAGGVAERYNASTNTWAITGAPAVRNNPALVTLASGSVLVAGGDWYTGTSTAYLASAEIFNPATGTWSATGSMTTARSMPGAVLLPSGEVLVSGGVTTGGTLTPTAELYDPTTKTWSSVGSLSLARKRPLSVVTGGGRVLVTGGETSAYGYQKAADLFDPKTKTWTTPAAMAVGRGDQAGARLPSGRVLIAGGYVGKGTDTNTAEFFGDALGTACTTGIECGSGFCTENVCCEASSCPAGSSCKTSEKPGKCATLSAATCTKPSDCASGFCVDAVCCDRACDQQCEACDAPDSKGKCTPIRGAAHGSRATCDNGGASACAARECDGAKDVKTCVGFASGASVVCKAGSCIGSTFIGPSTCDGTGGCVTPREIACDPYACSAAGCLTSCKLDTDCLKGSACKGGACKPTGAECTPDGASSRAASGTITSCAPFRCTSSGECGTACGTSADCASGLVCNTDSKQCASGGSDSGGGGCAVTAPRGASGAAGALLSLVGLALLRARRRHPSTRGIIRPR